MLNFLDIGCSQDFDAQWVGLAPSLNYVGCDPDESECMRLTQNPPCAFSQARYLPYAITPEDRDYNLYVTQSPSCSSLLKPNTPYLERFMFSDFFHVEVEEKVQGVSLSTLVKQIGFELDILKMDVQGLELQLLNAHKDICSNALVIDLDVGFSRNYETEAVFWEISQWMESQGYLLFNLNINRVRRKAGNAHLDSFSDFMNIDTTNNISQPLWGNSLWVRDLIGAPKPTDKGRKQKLIDICTHLNFLDYRDELVASEEQ